MSINKVKDAKQKYRQLCADESTIPIFSRDWWLDTLCGEKDWGVCLVEKGNQIQATMPYYMRKRRGFTVLSQPQLTQTLGPWIRPSRAKYSKALGQQKDLMESLIGQLPLYDYFSQNWHYSNTNWLPFYWHGFSQTTNYTYVISDLSDFESIWSNVQSNIRGDIRKAENRFDLKVRADLTIDDFLVLNRLTFSRQGKELPYTEDFVWRLENSTSKRQCSKILIAEDPEGKRHAGVFIVWDENSAYYLMGGGDPELRNSGATSLCMWEAIKFASTVTQRFDFEGSMIESVERFFRAFGARQVPYFMVSRCKSRLLRMRQCLLGLRG